MSYRVEREIPHRPFRITVDRPEGTTRSSQSGIAGHQEWMRETGIRDISVTVVAAENSSVMSEHADEIVPFPGKTIVLEGHIEDPKLRAAQIWEMLTLLASCVAYKMGKSPLSEYKDQPMFARVTFGRRTRIIRTMLGREADWATEERPKASAQQPRRRRRVG